MVRPQGVLCGGCLLEFQFSVDLENLWMSVGLVVVSSEFIYFPTNTCTTDVQSISVVPGKRDARVTCNFTIGSSCQACQLKWTDINSGVSSAGETAMRKERDAHVQPQSFLLWLLATPTRFQLLMWRREGKFRV